MLEFGMVLYGITSPLYDNWHHLRDVPFKQSIQLFTMSLPEKYIADDEEKKSGVCHMLPCSIDFSGRVEGAQHFFQPTPLEEDSQKTEQEQYLAATLRGRGLMGQKTIVSPPHCRSSLRVFKVGAGDAGVTVEGSNIEEVVEWQHEHNPGNLNMAKSRLSLARAWCQVAQAMHEPLSPPEDF
mmetsp:Transcript_10634/g.20491  ORF Transcript_10634/g.20491 Transcript_10634/m.20491 type:complete len:182 (+) Transcript_10634:88-633(+)